MPTIDLAGHDVPDSGVADIPLTILFGLFLIPFLPAYPGYSTTDLGGGVTQMNYPFGDGTIEVEVRGYQVAMHDDGTGTEQLTLVGGTVLTVRIVGDRVQAAEDINIDVEALLPAIDAYLDGSDPDGDLLRDQVYGTGWVIVGREVDDVLSWPNYAAADPGEEPPLFLGPDRFLGNGGNDLIQLYSGNDTGLGGSGDDTLLGDAGRDRLLGETGNDSIDGGTEQDTMLGGSGNDVMNGGDGDDVLRGNGDHDLEHGDGGNDIVIGGTGRDTLYGDAGNDTLRGNGGFDTVNGGNGNDFVAGGAQADLVLGSAGNDTCEGGGGFDTIDGGTGDDVLTGNFNADQFVFADGHGDDTITDFEATNNAEKIDLSAVQRDHLSGRSEPWQRHAGRGHPGGRGCRHRHRRRQLDHASGVSLSDLDANDFIF
ncbi:MAG: calcium-binding protein [Paracoccaceae bacterium]